MWHITMVSHVMFSCRDFTTPVFETMTRILQFYSATIDSFSQSSHLSHAHKFRPGHSPSDVPSVFHVHCTLCSAIALCRMWNEHRNEHSGISQQQLNLFMHCLWVYHLQKQTWWVETALPDAVFIFSVKYENNTQKLPLNMWCSIIHVLTAKPTLETTLF